MTTKCDLVAIRRMLAYVAAQLDGEGMEQVRRPVCQALIELDDLLSRKPGESGRLIPLSDGSRRKFEPEQ